MKDFRAYNKLCVGRHIRQILNYMPYILFHWKGGYNKVLIYNKYFRIQWYLYHNIPLDLPMNNRWGRHCCRVGTCHRGLSPRKDRFWRRFPDQTDISENRCRGWVLFCSASRANNGCRPPRPEHSRWEQLNYYSRWGKTFCNIPCSLNKSSRHSLYRM